MKIQSTKPKSDPLQAFEQARVRPQKKPYVLRLYVTGATPQSVRAIANIKKLCEEHLKGRYELDVVDLYQQPHLAQGEQIIAAPTLVKKSPLPQRRIIGDMSRSERVLAGLGMQKNI